MSCSSKRNSDVGSCMSTLVSSTNSVAGPLPRGLRTRSAGAGAIATAGAASAGPGAAARSRSARLLDGLDGLQHFFDVAGDRQAAPLGAQDAGAVDQEGAALDALHLLAVHDLVLDDAEHVAELLFGVGDQLERKL